VKRAILLTWDVEEYDAPVDFGARPLVDGGLSRGVEIWREWLETSTRWKAPGTVFVTARLAEAAPILLRETGQRGYEIASHAWSHEKNANLELEKSRRQISELARTEVVGFRSPRLRPVPLQEVRSAGYRYDASSNPAIVPGRYCRVSQRRKPYQTSGLWEVPASVLPLVRFPLFWASFHLLPLPLYLVACRLLMAWDGVLTLYFHPWELAELGEKEIPFWVRRRSRARRIERMETLIRSLREYGEFRTVRDYLGV
jgi:peptidoglycan/xylan/chitin deacetylase (PgdA/CDA1 family)